MDSNDIIKLIQTFLNPETDPSMITKVHNLLIHISNDPTTWDVLLGCLRHDNQHVVNYVAFVLLDKIKMQWHLLPGEKQGEYVTFFIQNLIFFSKYGCSQSLLNSIASCLASIASFTVPHMWPGFIEDILNFSESENSDLLNASVTVIVRFQEIILDSVMLTRRREELVSYFEDNEDLVIDTFIQCLNDETQSVNLKSLCLTSLSRWEFAIDKISNIHLLDSIFSILEVKFQLVLDVSEFFENLSDSLYEDEYYTLKCGIIQRMIILFQKISQNLGNNSKVDDYDEIEILKSYSHLFSAIGASLSDLLVSETNLGIAYSNILLQFCQGDLDHEIVSNTFDYWNELSVSLLHSDNQRIEEFKNIYWILTRSIIGLSTFRNYPDQTSEYKVDKILKFREDSTEVLIPTFWLLQDQLIESVINIIQLNLQQQNPFPIEACISALNSISDEVSHEFNSIYNIIALFEHFQNEKFLMNISISFLGNYANWISHHQDCLGNIIAILLYGLSQPSHQKVAVNALNRICKVGGRKIVEYLPSILRAGESIFFSQSKERELLLSSTTRLIQDLPYSECYEILNQISKPIILRINNLLKKQDVQDTMINELAAFHSLCTIHLQTDQIHPLNKPLMDLFPMFKFILESNAYNEDIHTRIFSIINSSIISFKSAHIYPFFVYFMEFTLNCYQVSPIFEHLKVLMNMLSIFDCSKFGPYEENSMTDQLLTNFVFQFCEVTFTDQLQVFSIPLFAQWVLNILCSLAKQHLTIFDRLILQTGVISHILPLSTMVNERSALKSLYYFVELIVSSKNKFVKQKVQENIGDICSFIIGCVSDGPKTLHSESVLIFLALKDGYSNQKDLQTIMIKEITRNHVITHVDLIEKQTFVMKLFSTNTETELKEFVLEFSLTCKKMRK